VRVPEPRHFFSVKPLFHPRLVNDPFGDPGLYIDFLFEKRALLFDLGDLSPLASRQILKVSHAFVSHTHMDHFAGFDLLLRLLLGREKVLHLFGPPGFIDRVEHKLAAYTWNLVANYESDFVVRVTEGRENGAATAEFRTRTGFQREPVSTPELPSGLLLDEETFQVRAAVLDHQTPCLAFALEEKFHVNVWKNGLEELGLPTGPWLRDLKSAVARGEPDRTEVPVRWSEDGAVRERTVSLGDLKEKVLRIVPGQKIVYVTDAGFTTPNIEAILDLARNADSLFIETAFTHEEEQRAAEKYHLTARQAGWLAREAGAKRLVPFHFSPKHTEEGERLVGEAMEAFAGSSPTAG
jgi:ribonuclease Z